MDAQQKTLLLAGAGDLALRTAHLMLRQGFQVSALRRSPMTTADPITWLQGDLGNPDSLSALPRHFSHVLYAPTPDARTPAAYQTVFRNGIENLLDHVDLDTLRRIVFVSSTAVYGPSDGWVSEDTPPAPEGFNGQILLDSEQHLQARASDKAIVFRPSGLYGPGRVQLLHRLKQGQAGTTKAWANRFHIEDATRACAHLLLVDSPQPTYIGTDDTPWPIDELYTRLAAMLGAPAPQPGTSRSTSTGKRLLNGKLKASGFHLKWPDSLAGYAALIQQEMG